MGDSNPAAYELAMELMVDVNTRLEPLCATPDGLGVHERGQAELTRENAEVGVRDDLTGVAPTRQELDRKQQQPQERAKRASQEWMLKMEAG